MNDKAAMKHCVIWPARCIATVFQEYATNVGRPLEPNDFLDFGIEESVKDYYLENMEIVPTLNDRPIGLLPPTCLVRVRGMIQDVKDPEMYPTAFLEVESLGGTSKWKTAKYLEHLDKIHYVKQTFDMTNIQQRTPAYLIPVPCETGWVRALAHPPAPVSDFYSHLTKKVSRYVLDEDLPLALGRPKREREEYELPADSHLLDGRAGVYHLPLDSPANVAAALQGKLDQVDNEDVIKQPASITRPDEDVEHRFGRDLNFPVPNNFGLPVWAKIYPPHELTVNSLVDCIGILTESPQQAAQAAELSNEEKFAHIPAPQAPRFHAILIEHIGEGNPLIPSNSIESEAKRLEMLPDFKMGRAALLAWMTEVLGGDNLTAEYVLCNMIARPIRRLTDETYGHVPINIIGCSNPFEGDQGDVHSAASHSSSSSSSYASSSSSTMCTTVGNLPPWIQTVRGRLEYLLETIATKRHTIPLDPTYLLMRNMSPYASEETNRLEAGELQLPSGTHVIIDETALTVQANIPDIQRIRMEQIGLFTHRQEVQYDFGVYSLPYHVDCPTILLSEAKSLYGLTCVIRFKGDLNLPAPSPQSEDTLNYWRAMIGYLRQASWPEQSEEVLHAIEEDYVMMRQVDNEYLTPELFAHWNALARASAISNGESVLTLDRWKKIKEFEATRLSRC